VVRGQIYHRMVRKVGVLNWKNVYVERIAAPAGSWKRIGGGTHEEVKGAIGGNMHGLNLLLKSEKVVGGEYLTGGKKEKERPNVWGRVVPSLAEKRWFPLLFIKTVFCKNGCSADYKEKGGKAQTEITAKRGGH